MMICDGCGRPAEHKGYAVNAADHHFATLDLCQACHDDLTNTIKKAVDGWHQPRATQLKVPEVPAKKPPEAVHPAPVKPAEAAEGPPPSDPRVPHAGNPPSEGPPAIPGVPAPPGWREEPEDQGTTREAREAHDRQVAAEEKARGVKTPPGGAKKK